MHSNPLAFASNAPNPNSPLMMLLGTVENQYSLHSNFHKQPMMMMKGVGCKKNFENWLRFDEV